MMDGMEKNGSKVTVLCPLNSIGLIFKLERMF